MSSRQVSLSDLSESCVTINLPPDVASLLEREAKAARRSVSAMLREWAQDHADGREAARRLKKIESGKVKTVPAEDVYKRLGI